MLLKTLTTLFIVIGVLLALSFPWVVGPTPPLLHRKSAMATTILTPAQRSQLLVEKKYSLRLGLYLTSLLVCFVAASICAVILARKVRLAYQEEARQNLEFLIESSLRTHQKQPPPPSETHEQDA